jgi:lysine-specific demethylase 3
VTEPSTLGSSVIAAEATPITSVVNTAVVNSEVMIYEQKKSEEAAEPEKKVDEFKYVHKLKKAWIMKAEAESSCAKTPSSNSSSTTSPQLTRATPSPEGSTKSCSSSKGGLPSAVKSAAEALKVNGHSSMEEENDLDDFSSDNEEKPAEKPKRGRPGPKPKGKPGPKPKQAPRKKLPSESDNNSESEKDSDSSKTSKKSEVMGGKKRGRKPGSKVKKSAEVAEEPKNKKLRAEESSSSAPSEPFAKPSVTQLKKTGDSFLQDASCFEVAPKLNKCRECRWSQAQRQKQSMANIFCRFYAFRRLRYTKNGQIAQAGFCDPKQDAQIEDLKLWLPSQDLSPQNMDKETARTILTNLSSQFRTIYKQELEAETFAEDLTPAWKRVVQGVREMCDVCEATLFNKHWACGKCGFVVCIDCYRARVNNQPSPAVTVDSEAKDKDFFHWLLCNNNKSHQLDSLMLTQIIAGDALEEVSNRLGVLARLGKKSNGWKSPDKKPMVNGIKDETDVKDEDEADDGKSSLRDLLGTEEEMSPGPPEEREVLRMDLADTEAEFPGAPHRWICDGTLLRLEEPGNSHNLGLFKLVWKRAQPVIVTGLGDRLESRLWQAETLANLPDPAYDPTNPEASSISHGQSIKKFFDGFNAVAKRPVTDAGEPMTLKFKENWPSQEDHFAELLPAQFKDLMRVLPLPDYTSREGRLNLAARLPECFVRLDLGPRMWGGYSKATFNLQYNVADAVHLMTSRGETRDLKGDLADVIQSTGCDEASAALALEKPNDVGAIWHIFHPSQADKIKDFVMKNSKTDSKKKPKDPLWVGHMYLKERLLEKLETETSIQPWTFLQSLGEAVIIPAGAPYQVKVLNSSLFCQSEFVSPEQMRQVMRLSFTDIGQQFDDRLQVKNVVFHSCKDALSILERPEKEEGGK